MYLLNYIKVKYINCQNMRYISPDLSDMYAMLNYTVATINLHRKLTLLQYGAEKKCE